METFCTVIAEREDHRTLAVSVTFQLVEIKLVAVSRAGRGAWRRELSSAMALLEETVRQALREHDSDEIG